MNWISSCDVGGAGESLFHFVDGLGSVELGAKQQAVSALQRAEALGGKSFALQADGVDAVAGGLALGDHAGKWRHVLGDDRGSADVGIAADAAELVHGRKGADGGEIFHGDVAGQSGAVGENGLVADVAIMRDVRVGHEQAAAADGGGAAAADCAAADGDVFAESIFVADDEMGFFAGKFQILGIAADGAEGMENIVAARDRGP